MFNLSELWQRLEKCGIAQKPFSQLSKEEVESLIECVISSIDVKQVPVYGWDKPYIDRHGWLHIPFDAHPSYHWWKRNGQSVSDTLAELDASWEVAAPYVRGMDTMVSEEEWEEFKRKKRAAD